MDSNRKVRQVFNNIPQGKDEESDQNTFCNSVQTDIYKKQNSKLERQL